MPAEAHVYALIAPDGTRCYVGSTTESVHARLVRHRWRAATGERPHSRLHNFMAEHGVENFDAELLETVPIADRIRTEAHFIRVHGVLNRVIPGRTRAERRREARDAILVLRALLEAIREAFAEAR